MVRVARFLNITTKLVSVKLVSVIVKDSPQPFRSEKGRMRECRSLRSSQALEL